MVEEIPKDSYANKVLGVQPLNKNSQNVLQPQTIQNLSQAQKHQQLLNNLLKSTIGKKETPKTMEKPNGRNIFHGKAVATEKKDENEEETNLAADVELVAFGVNKSAEPEHLLKFLTDKGIKVEKVVCLTNLELIKEEKVRAKTMKVTVKATDLERALNPEVWPLRVGVRFYKAPSRRQAPEEGGQAGEGGLQERQGGRGQGASQGGRGPRQGGLGGQSFPPGSREWGRSRRNRYQEVGGWQQPRSMPITLESLQEALSQAHNTP